MHSAYFCAILEERIRPGPEVHHFSIAVSGVETVTNPWPIPDIFERK